MCVTYSVYFANDFITNTLFDVQLHYLFLVLDRLARGVAILFLINRPRQRLLYIGLAPLFFPFSLIFLRAQVLVFDEDPHAFVRVWEYTHIDFSLGEALSYLVHEVEDNVCCHVKVSFKVVVLIFLIVGEIDFSLLVILVHVRTEGFVAFLSAVENITIFSTPVATSNNPICSFEFKEGLSYD